MIYLDHAATSPMRPGVADAMAPFESDIFGNSSGVHEVSRRAKNALEDARERVASLVSAKPMEIVFTSGGTESDNLAIKGAVWSRGPSSTVVTVSTEHEAILDTVDFVARIGHQTHLTPVDSRGFVEERLLLDSLTADTAVVSLMLVNNETGLINDVARLARAIHETAPRALVHTDAVQAFAAMSLDVEKLEVDMMSLSAHKFGGPKGVGCLYVREGTALEPLLHGGGQELGRRSGTHDVAGAVGLAKAMELAESDRGRFVAEVGQARDEMEKLLVEGVAGLEVNTPGDQRSPHHLNVRAPGIKNETLLMRLDMAGVAASAGSACQSGAATVSHVLEGMGLTPKQARESVRFSFGWSSTLHEAREAAGVVTELAGALR